jgi:hypothetical protein
MKKGKEMIKQLANKINKHTERKAKNKLYTNKVEGSNSTE